MSTTHQHMHTQTPSVAHTRMLCCDAHHPRSPHELGRLIERHGTRRCLIGSKRLQAQAGREPCTPCVWWSANQEQAHRGSSDSATPWGAPGRQKVSANITRTTRAGRLATSVRSYFCADVTQQPASLQVRAPSWAVTRAARSDHRPGTTPRLLPTQQLSRWANLRSL